MGKGFEQGHALVVGVGADLPNTVKDAEGLAGILRDAERCAYPAGQVHLLTEAQATRQGILDKLGELSQTAHADSTVVIYFSGHGYQAKSTFGEFYYLIPFKYDLNRLHETTISGKEFAEKVAAIPAKKMLILLDCCHAGGIEATKAPPGATLTKAPLPSEAYSLLQKGSGRVVIASSTETELSYAGDPFSAFTLALVEAFCGKGASKQDGYVRAADLALYAREMVPRRTMDRQHPVLNFEQADNFVVAYYAAGDAAPKALPFSSEPKIEDAPGQWSGAARATLRGDGAIAIGAGATAVGRGGVMARDVSGPIVTGDHARIGPELSGDFRGANVNVGANLKKVRQAAGRVTAADPAEKERLQQLIGQLEAALKQVPADRAADAETVSSITETLVTAAAAEKPNRTLLKITGEGLKEAAEGLAAIAPAVLSIATQVVAAVGRMTGAG